MSEKPTRPGLRLAHRLPAVLVFSAVCLGVATLEGQEPPPPVQQEPRVPEHMVEEEEDRSLHSLARPTNMSPSFGPPGTIVELTGSLLPALTPMQVAFGGSRFGFEALMLTITDATGELSVTVEIPDWASKDRTHRFIVFNAYFTDTYAATPPFHVTDSDGKIHRVGEVIWTGPECITVATRDEEVFHLIGDGDLEDLDMGARVAVEGWVVDISEAMERVEEFCPDEGIPLAVAKVSQSEHDS